VQIVGATYTRDGIDRQTGEPFVPVSVVAPRPEPVFGIVFVPQRSRWRFGLTSLVPNAVGAAWPETITLPDGQTILGPTRYHVTDSRIFHVMTQLGASYRIGPTLAIGASVHGVVTSVYVHKHVDLLNQSPIRDTLPCATNPLGCEDPDLSAPVTITGGGFSAGGSLGILWMPTPNVRIGAGYLSATNVPVNITTQIDTTKIEDFARQFFPGYQALDVNGSGHATMVVPQRFHVAAAVDVSPAFELAAELRWINYAATETVTGILTTRNSTLLPDALTIATPNNNEWSITVRVVDRISPTAKLGASFNYVTSTVPDAYDAPSNLDFQQYVFKIGGQLAVTPRLTLGATLSHSYLPSRTITASAWDDAAPEPYNYPAGTGSYHGFSERVGVDISYGF
jgi:long-subunit fatty acid transport protein